MKERLEEKYKSTIKVEECCGIQDEQSEENSPAKIRGYSFFDDV